MKNPNEPMDRRGFLAASVGLALLVPAAVLAACGQGEPAATPTPATPAAPAPPPAAPPAPAPPAAAAEPDALVTEIPANAALVTALDYANTSPKPEQICSGCQLYTPAGAARGKCTLFPTGMVAAQGHCTSWVQRTA